MGNRDRFNDIDSDLGGYYARDDWRMGYGGDYARERGFRGVGPKNYRRSDERIAHRDE